MGVDVMVSGHTHKLCVRQGSEGGLYVNPGSVSYILNMKHLSQVFFCFQMGRTNITVFA